MNFKFGNKPLFDFRELIDLRDKTNKTPDSIESGRVKLPRGNIGPSGQKFRSLVSKLPSDKTYLEIGVFKGRTILTSAAENPSITHVGIDNFSQFDPDGVNKTVIKSAVEELNLNNIDFIGHDFKEYLLDRALQPKKDVGLFFCDFVWWRRFKAMARVSETAG